VSEPLNLEEFEPIARERLDAGVYDYYAGGADDEITVAANRSAFQQIALRYRVLVDVSAIETSCEVFGARLDWPVILAPTALHKMAHPDGEAATARAAAASATLQTLSSISSIALEDVAAAAPGGRRWFQLYHFGDRAVSEALIRRASEAGYEAIVLTVDAPRLGRRERDFRHEVVIPPGIDPVHFTVDPRTVTGEDQPLATYIDQPYLTWDDLAWIRAASSLPVLIKGVVRADDAKRALDAGVAGLWVSNHGGRQLDTSIPTARALPEVAEAAAGQVPVIVDGGVRRGTDVLKGLALGADLVAIGRPQLWGLAAGGEEGVARVLSLLRDELTLAMALAGCRSIAEIGADLLA